MIAALLVVIHLISCDGHCCCDNNEQYSPCTSSSRFSESNDAVCRQGKAGPRGEKGNEGQKGEAGAKMSLDHAHVSKISELGNRLRLLEESNAHLKTVVNCLKNPSYTYKESSTEMNWHSARRYCHSLGGDLAVHGMKDFARRLEIVSSLT